MENALRACCRVCVVVAVAAVWAAGFLQPAMAQQPAGHAGAGGAAEYLEGVGALEAGDFTTAAAAFGRAIQADNENPDYFAARGAVLVMTDQYDAATKDLNRALRLQPGHHGATVWLGVITRIGGKEFEVSGQEYCLDRDGYEAHLYAITMTMAEPARRRIDIERAGGDWPDAPQPDDPELLQRVKAAKAEYPKVAAVYARVLRGNPALDGLVFDLGKKQYDAREYAKALATLEQAEEKKPDDPELLYYLAGCRLSLGNADGARRTYTRVLTHWPAHSYSYLGRAVANAKLGNAAAARKDIETARGLDASATERFLATEQKVIDAALAGVPQANPVDLWRQLKVAALAKAGDAELIDAATAMLRAMNAKRLRYDELYQEGIRVRDAAIRANPRSADAHAAMADFLYTEVDVRGSGVEERAPIVNWRYQTEESRQRELDRAEMHADQALQLDPNCVMALSAKAAVRMSRLQWADGETLLKRAMEINPSDPKTLNLFARVLVHVAGVRKAKAWQLRQTDTWEDSQYIYWRHPSQAELDQADELDRQAQALFQWASQHIQQAAAAKAGTAEGSYWQGFLALHYDRSLDAIAPLQKAVQMDPGNVVFAEALANAYEAAGKSKEGIEERFRALNLLQTTDATLIRLAWECVKTDRWRSAREFLDRAVNIDPADPRICAYYGRCAQGEENADEAIAYRRMALAIDEARVRLAGNTYQPTGSRALYAGDIGLTGTTRNHLGAYFSSIKDWARAQEMYQANVAMEPRLPKSEWQRDVEVFSGMPDDRTNVQGVIGTAHFGLAVALSNQGRPEDAADHYVMAMALTPHESPNKDKQAFGYAVYRSLMDKGGEALAARHFPPNYMAQYGHEDHVTENRRIFEQQDAARDDLTRKMEELQNKLMANDQELREVQGKLRNARGEERDKLQEKYEKLQQKRQDIMEEMSRVMQGANGAPPRDAGGSTGSRGGRRPPR